MSDRQTAPDWFIEACAHPQFPGGGNGKVIASYLWPNVAPHVITEEQADDIDSAFQMEHDMYYWSDSPMKHVQKRWRDCEDEMCVLRRWLVAP